MIGNHGYQIILDNYVKSLRDFDVTAAYEGMREEVSELCTPYLEPSCRQTQALPIPVPGSTCHGLASFPGSCGRAWERGYPWSCD